MDYTLGCLRFARAFIINSHLPCISCNLVILGVES